ncbi:MAG: flagellar hook-basal body complex protein [Desulfobacter sp.]|nr:MAG: flagellar hook-basal body complex protein [Desulfobacter sp.]
MSLSSSLFTGTSGLKNMGNALQVTGNNISNINTVGFKKGRMTFADTLYESVATQAGAEQLGRGMAVGDVAQNFNQGSFESTGNATDLSIGGNGFFIMRQSNSENLYYTRAGNFYFDKGGQLINPEGYIVQGWELNDDGEDTGSIKDIVLQAFTSPPKKSSQITAITNLDADAASKAIVLSNNWDSGEDTYLPSNNYEYQTVTKVYDALGSTHDVSIFYDKKSGTEWEYVVTCNPEEDKRDLVQGTDSKGLLARGTITFSQSSGDILDFTMDEFTGRLGNFTANGVNTVDNIEYKIMNSEAMAKDGYGFSFEYDGAVWQFEDKDRDGSIDPATEKPSNYPNAEIIYSDNDEIHLVLDQTSPPKTDPDLKIQLAQAAVATDSLGFDINDPNNLHVQGIEGTRYFGETANDNTKLEINDPGVMDKDSKGLGIIWNPYGGTGNSGQWYWSNPEVAAQPASAQTLVTGVNITDGGGGAVTTTTSTTAIVNAQDVSMVASGIKLAYNGTNWEWNDDIKSEDFTSTFTFVPKNDPKVTVTSAGSQGAFSTTAGPQPELHWTGSVWSTITTGVSNTANIGGNGAGLGRMEIVPSASNNTTVVFRTWYLDGTAPPSANPTTVQYSFSSALNTAAGQNIKFDMDPTPPREYADAAIINTGGSAVFSIDFDGDSSPDLTFNPSAGGAINANSHFAFNTDPNVPPEEYPDATLKGDHEEAVIDLDGSGNDDDNDDIRFTFTNDLKYGTSTHPYNDRSEIDFDILGSTAWTTINKSDIATTGYYGFTTDFLGGDFGATETKIEMNIGTKYVNNAFVNDSLSTTQYSKASSTIFQDADGYAAGDLTRVQVASDGIMTGIYSNGQLIPLFRVGLANFRNNYGLSNEGSNLFMETRASGTAITNKPGENGLGNISPNSLEMSNVDISEEFVNMITNQRGFQANSKTITTVDDMMQTVIQMKR